MEMNIFTNSQQKTLKKLFTLHCKTYGKDYIHGFMFCDFIKDIVSENQRGIQTEKNKNFEIFIKKCFQWDFEINVDDMVFKLCNKNDYLGFYNIDSGSNLFSLPPLHLPNIFTPRRLTTDIDLYRMYFKRNNRMFLDKNFNRIKFKFIKKNI